MPTVYWPHSSPVMKFSFQHGEKKWIIRVCSMVISSLEKNQAGKGAHPCPCVQGRGTRAEDVIAYMAWSGKAGGGEGGILGRGNTNSETLRRGADLCLRNGKQANCAWVGWGLGRERKSRRQDEE